MNDTITELEGARDAAFTGALAHWTGSIAFHDHPEAVATERLADPAFFGDLIARFGARHEGADRRAIVSFWSQHYFAHLTIALTALCLCVTRPVPLDLASLGVRFCSIRGTPLCFHLRCTGTPRDSAALIKALYEEQVAGAVSQLRRHGGLSARLLWENVGGYGLWILGEIARTRPDVADVASALLTDADWPRAACAWLPHQKSSAREARPLARRVCCLRYMLPGVGRCAEICPLRSGGAG